MSVNLSPSAGDKIRLFLALWPQPEVRAALAQYRDAWRWPAKVAPVHDAKLHLTLHFIGDVARDRLPELRQQLQQPFEPFDLRMGTPDLWPHGVAVLRPHAESAGLSRLRAALGDTLEALDLPIDGREFHPHVTLARRASAAVMPAQPLAIAWHVDRFALVESCFDPHRTYTVLTSWDRLGAAT